MGCVKVTSSRFYGHLVDIHAQEGRIKCHKVVHWPGQDESEGNWDHTVVTTARNLYELSTNMFLVLIKMNTVRIVEVQSSSTSSAVV